MPGRMVAVLGGCAAWIALRRRSTRMPARAMYWFTRYVKAEQPVKGVNGAFARRKIARWVLVGRPCRK